MTELDAIEEVHEHLQNAYKSMCRLTTVYGVTPARAKFHIALGQAMSLLLGELANRECSQADGVLGDA